MMKLLAMVLFVVFALTTYNCQNENQGNRELDLVTVFLDSIRKNVYYSEVFEEISYVVLHGMPEDEFFSDAFTFANPAPKNLLSASVA